MQSGLRGIIGHDDAVVVARADGTMLAVRAVDQRVLDSVTDHARLVAGMDVALMAEVTMDGCTMHVIAASGTHADRLRGARITLTAAVACEAIQLSSSGDMPCDLVVVDDFWVTCPDVAHGPEKLGRAVVIPLGSGPAVVGVMVAANLAPRPAVGGEQLDGLRAFAPKAALALRYTAVRRSDDRSGSGGRGRRTTCDCGGEIAQLLYGSATVGGSPSARDQSRSADRAELVEGG